VQFTDLSTPTATSWLWNFGDGTASGTTRNPSHTYSTPGTYNVSLRVQNRCGSDSVTKTGYITVTDACPNPVYTLQNANWTNRTDADADGYFESGRLNWNANVTTGCTKSVFARVYYRAVGDTAWTFYQESACYTITGNNALDTRFVIVSGLDFNCYDFRIDLYECNGTTVKATRAPADDADLTAECFEP
jgi:PKD repeat protein